MSGPAGAATEIGRRLRARYPEARYALEWRTPLQLLVATILAAQSTDEKVNQLTPALFARYPDAGALARADLGQLQELIRPAGLAPQKSKAIQGACAALEARFGGQVPRSMEELLTLPGVGRKTANVVLVTAYGVPSGVIVDTHVKRLAGRLGLSSQKDADQIEADLMRQLSPAEWLWWPAALILHGRETCRAKRPACAGCPLEDLCPRIGVQA